MPHVLNVNTYLAGLHHASTDLVAVADRPGSDPHLIRRAIADLQALSTVRLPDGRIIHTDIPALADGLRSGDRQQILQVSSSLNNLEALLSGRSLQVHFSNGDLSQLDAVLRDSRFHPAQSIFDIVGNWILGLLRAIFTATPGGFDLSKVLIIAGALLLVAALVTVSLALVDRSFQVRRSSELPAQPGAEPLTSGAAELQASEAAAAGDYRLALRYLLLATLLHLREAHLLDLRPGETNREYLRDLLEARRAAATPSGDVAAALEPLVDAFDRVWYGHAPLNASEFEECRKLAGRVIAALAARAVA